MLHAAFVLLFMLFAADLMAWVPMAALAAILFVVAWGMSEHERFIALLKMPNGDRGVLLLTFGLTVFVDLTVAIGVGVTIASLLFMMRMSESVQIEDIRQAVRMASSTPTTCSSVNRCRMASRYSASMARFSLVWPAICSIPCAASASRRA
jgi:MFS superfamily sulfate permease-like transporter